MLIPKKLSSHLMAVRYISVTFSRIFSQASLVLGWGLPKTLVGVTSLKPVLTYLLKGQTQSAFIAL